MAKSAYLPGTLGAQWIAAREFESAVIRKYLPLLKDPAADPEESDVWRRASNVCTVLTEKAHEVFHESDWTEQVPDDYFPPLRGINSQKQV